MITEHRLAASQLWRSLVLVLSLVCVFLCAMEVRCEGLPVPLIPRPREFSAGPRIALSDGLAIIVLGKSEEDRFASSDLREELHERGIRIVSVTKAALIVRLLRVENSDAERALREANIKFPGELREEGYVITMRNHTINVIGASSAGVFYGVQTLKQLIQGNGSSAVIQTGQIRDWPAMRYRGMDSDLSRGPLPTLDFQKRQIRMLAAYKINIYSPYFEHTFSYISTPLAGLPGGAITQEEAAELVRYAAPYHIMIVPQQEAFGHLHRFLSFEQNAELAETPLGMVLAPDRPGSLTTIRQWFGELAKIFPAPFVHIGADETFDLGVGQTAARVQQSGRGAVYVDFLKQIHSALEPLHKRVLFWGDMAMNESQMLVSALPNDMIAVAWHYSSEPQGFDQWLLPYKRAGMETWVSPGANNWGQVYPDDEETLRNVQGFVRDGQKLGSTGMLMTEWRDDGEGLFLQNWYGVLFAAAAAWQSGESDIAVFQSDYGPVFHGDSTGKLNEAQRELIACHQLLKKAGVGDESDALFWLDPWSPTGLQTGKKLLPSVHQLRLHAERALTLIAEIRDNKAIRNRDAVLALELGARRFDFLGFKFQSAFAIIEGYDRAVAAASDEKKWSDVDRELWTITGSDGRCDDIQQGYNYIRDEYRDVWLLENRPYWLENILDRYDAAAQLWWKRSAAFADVQARWNVEHRLPSPEDLGLPKLPATAR